MASIMPPITQYIPHTAEDIQAFMHRIPIDQPTYEVRAFKKPDGSSRIGMFALSDREKGSRLVLEEPEQTFTMPDISKGPEFIFDSLHVDTQNRLMRLSNESYPDLPEDPQIPSIHLMRWTAGTLAFFPEGSCIRHSCRPNASCFWDVELDRQQIFAQRDIRCGDEITICYMDRDGMRGTPYNQRQTWLLQNFGFDCTCELCSAPLAYRQQHDAYLAQIAALTQDLHVHHILMKLHDIHKTIDLLEKANVMDDTFVILFDTAFTAAAFRSDMARASIFASRGVEVARWRKGVNWTMTNTFAARLLDPTADMHWQTAPGWERERDVVPVGLGPSEFEIWLWRLNERDW